MTTIAFDGETLAADTQTTGSYITAVRYKKIHTIGSTHVGCCGSNQQIELFLKWFRDQTKERPKHDELGDFLALIIKNGKAYESGELCQLVEVGRPVAIGSGGDFAMAAMMAGADAVQSVKIAMKLDPFTGGKVQSIKIK